LKPLPRTNASIKVKVETSFFEDSYELDFALSTVNILLKDAAHIKEHVKGMTDNEVEDNKDMR
jgi:hypothetical protein